MKDWIDRTKKQVKNDRYVETLAGFWRRLPGVDSNDRGIQADAMRQAINSPIQGSGASMTLKSIILINEMFKKKKLKSVLAITVHDSIVADVHVSELKIVYTIMKHVMENLPFSWITVPIVSDAEIGRDYGTLVGIDNIDEIINEGVFNYIDRKVLEKKKKDYEKAGLEMLTA
jgi:DNA polymerase-1